LRKRKFDKLKKAIFRLDVIRVFKKRPRRTKVSVAALDARKFKALYNIPIGQIRALIHSSFDGVLGSKYTRFLINLESRLDVAIFRLHFVDTVGQARQLINHGKITVNGQVLNKQSYKLARNDIISCVFDLRPFILSNILRRMLPFIRSEYYYYYPIYYEVNYRILSAKVVHVSKPFKDT
jgi:ribosomal protein S4